jgi:hypothetical protein
MFHRHHAPWAVPRALAGLAIYGRSVRIRPSTLQLVNFALDAGSDGVEVPCKQLHRSAGVVTKPSERAVTRAELRSKAVGMIHAPCRIIRGGS